MSKNEDRLLGHAADNDGIDEYDNALPDWWVGLFLFSIVCGIGYAIEYHFVSHRSQLKYYEAEMAMAKEKWPDTGPKAIVFDEATVSAGAQVFKEQCVACHGADLHGGIGPNLLDAAWIHGAEPEQIRTTITNGVPEKGMPTWGPILGPDKIAKVAAYVASEFQKTGLTPVLAAPAPTAVQPAGG